MKIKLIKLCEYGSAGDVLDVPESSAVLIIGRGLAERLNEAKAIESPPADKSMSRRTSVKRKAVAK